MVKLSPDDTAMLHRIATPEVNGVPGALGKANIGALLAAGFVTFGFAPNGDDQVTEANAWVEVTAAGRAWMGSYPA